MWTTCPVCGKGIAVMWPQLYVYRRGDDYLCGENCMIVYDTKQTLKSNEKGVEKMPSGQPITEMKYWAVKGALTNGMAMQKIQKTLKVGKATVDRVKGTKDFQEFERERKERTRRANEQQKRSATTNVVFADDHEEPAIDMRQDLHDIAREMANIKSILLRLVDVLEK